MILGAGIENDVPRKKKKRKQRPVDPTSQSDADLKKVVHKPKRRRLSSSSSGMYMYMYSHSVLSTSHSLVNTHILAQYSSLHTSMSQVPMQTKVFCRDSFV